MRRAPVGAHYGLKDWLAQRATAVVMVVSAAVVAAAAWVVGPAGFEEWRGFVRSGVVRLALMLFVTALVWHAFIGVRDIVMDYLPGHFFRLGKMVGAFVYLLVCWLWAAAILL